MKIKKFEIVERCLFLKEDKCLIVGDLHLGYEDSLKSDGMLIPRTQMEETKKIFKKIFKKTGEVKQIILLGDVKHHFKFILKQEKDDFLNLIEFLERYILKDGKIIITKGNHDKNLKHIVDNYDSVELVNYFIIRDILFFHGDLFSLSCINFHIFDKNIKTIVKGHFHPAISLSDSSKKENYKCFLYGKFLEKDTIILPSFFPLIEGLDIFKHNQLNQKELLKCKAYVISNNKIFKFNLEELKSKRT